MNQCLYKHIFYLWKYHASLIRRTSYWNQTYFRTTEDQVVLSIMVFSV